MQDWGTYGNNDFYNIFCISVYRHFYTLEIYSFKADVFEYAERFDYCVNKLIKDEE